MKATAPEIHREPAVFTARIDPMGCIFAAPASVTLVHAALAVGIELPTSCRNGTCRTCICLLLEGKVEYRIGWPGLSTEEKAEGLILPCVAHPVTDVVIRQKLARRN